MRLFPPLAALAVLAVLALALPPIAQPPQYHDFADQRACGPLPNCLDTASNALFVLAGLWGLWVLWVLWGLRRPGGPAARRVCGDAREAWRSARHAQGPLMRAATRPATAIVLPRQVRRAPASCVRSRPARCASSCRR